MKNSMHLQDRDVALLAEIGQVGLLDTNLIHRRHFRAVSRRRCQQRLQEIQRHGLTHSVALTVWYGRSGGGQVPTIHCLTERGADAIESIAGIRPQRVLRSDPKPETLHHRLAVVQARLALDDGCRAIGLALPEWIMEQDRREDARPNDPPSRRRVLYHEFTAGGKKFTCQPDAACLMQIPRDANRSAAGTTPLLVFWEVDRSTERTAQTTGKCPGYGALLERREYRRYWPQAEQAPVRVFWVCRSRQRIESLVASLRDKPVAQCFRLTTADELRAETALTLPIWRTIDGHCREIIRLPPAMNLPTPDPLGHLAPHLRPHIGP
ncbi:MAG TPA: replication-relaxation family protein [Pirellulales bacterium]|nr:replication-relaxation family protein [Pirellulales bacterium]